MLTLSTLVVWLEAALTDELVKKSKIPTFIQHLFFSNQTQKYSKYAYFRNLKMTFWDFQNPNPRNMHT